MSNRNGQRPTDEMKQWAREILGIDSGGGGSGSSGSGSGNSNSNSSPDVVGVCESRIQAASVVPRGNDAYQPLRDLYKRARDILLEKDTSECVICLNKPPDTVLQPCGHRHVCWGCSLRVRECPICRTRIRGKEYDPESGGTPGASSSGSSSSSANANNNPDLFSSSANANALVVRPRPQKGAKKGASKGSGKGGGKGGKRDDGWGPPPPSALFGVSDDGLDGGLDNSLDYSVNRMNDSGFGNGGYDSGFGNGGYNDNSGYDNNSGYNNNSSSYGPYSNPPQQQMVPVKGKGKDKGKGKGV
jgi:hypothetical protein